MASQKFEGLLLRNEIDVIGYCVYFYFVNANL